MATRLYQREVTVATIKITLIDCATCGVPFGLTEEFEARRQIDGQTFYCPNGHSHAWKETEAMRLRKDLEATKERLAAERGWSQRLGEDLNAERKQHASTKGQLTKTRNRIQSGHCPECHQFFGQLKRHMESEHPQAIE